jgi:hypothetical protein
VPILALEDANAVGERVVGEFVGFAAERHRMQERERGLSADLRKRSFELRPGGDRTTRSRAARPRVSPSAINMM